MGRGNAFDAEKRRLRLNRRSLLMKASMLANQSNSSTEGAC